MNEYRIFPLGDNALTIEFGKIISEEFNQKVLDLDNYLQTHPFNGLTEIIPAYSSLTIFYDIFTVKNSFSDFPNTFSAIESLVKNILQNLDNLPKTVGRTLKIPVSFNKKVALDLEYVANSNNLKIKQVIEIFTSKTYRVYMLGFLPGFAYMGEIDDRIVTARKHKPRLSVPKGSVGIAGKQTGIYPLESPGGWQIIGKTDVELFTPNCENTTFFKTGDLVQFIETQ